jgi:hypothetical protein
MEAELATYGIERNRIDLSADRAVADWIYNTLREAHHMKLHLPVDEEYFSAPPCCSISFLIPPGARKGSL